MSSSDCSSPSCQLWSKHRAATWAGQSSFPASSAFRWWAQVQTRWNLCWCLFALWNAVCCLAAFASSASWLRCCSVWLLCCFSVCCWNPSWSVRITRNCMPRVKTTKRSWCWGCRPLSSSCWRYKQSLFFTDVIITSARLHFTWSFFSCRWPSFWMSPWSWAVSWPELCCPHRVTWSQQMSWDASSQSEISLPSSSLPPLVRHDITRCGWQQIPHDAALWFLFLLCFYDDAAGFHVFPTFVLYELTILLVLTLTLVIMKVRFCPSSLAHRAHALPPDSADFTAPSLSVHDGRAGAVGDLASWLAPHTLGRISRSGSGQRILLRVEQPCASCWHNFQGGQWFI